MYTQLVTIENDNQAEEFIVGIKAEKDELDRLNAVCDQQIEKYQNLKLDYQEQFQRSISGVMSLLGEYCRQKAVKATKTTQTYKLPSGTLKWLRRDAKPIRDDSKLLGWIRTVAPSFVRVKTTESPAWDELKKTLIECGDHYEYMIPDGELVPVEGVTLEEQPDVFEIR